MSTKIYIEGGGDSKELHTRCRQGFRKLFEKCGFAGRMPQLIACGSRTAAFNDFESAHARSQSGEFVAMLVDSEDPVTDIEKTWAHLKSRDNRDKPAVATDEQVLLMTTCMETWIVSDRPALRDHFSSCLRENALPPLTELELRPRGTVQDSLAQATRDCKNEYQKGKRSFQILENLDPSELRKYLPSFIRIERILSAKL